LERLLLYGPVGALVDRHFKYSANAWELKKIPSSCPHCEAGHDVTYEVKHGKVYRTSNEAEFSTMCSASRYGFDFCKMRMSTTEDYKRPGFPKRAN